MSTAVESLRAPVPARHATRGVLARASGLLTYVLLVALLVEALLEGWLLMLLAQGFHGATVAGLDATDWLKALRNGGYLALGVASLVHVVAMRELHRFRQPVDIALVVLGLAMLVAGFAGGSSLLLTAHGMFVYLRGAIVFYAVRALAPDWSRARPIVWLIGAIVVLNVVIAVAQSLLGVPLHATLGFTDFTWANAHRAQGLLSHPNHLGHVIGLAMLGVIAWNLAGMRRRWWILLAFLAIGLALAQSRESLVAVVAGFSALVLLQSGHLRRLVGAVAITLVVTGLVWTIQPSGWQELARKIGGVVNAVEVPAGAEAGQQCDPAVEECTVAGLPTRSTRVLFYQQGLRLWLQSPIVGYGVGQFGGGVASQHNPEWHLNPRFGPEGFRLHGFQGTQVDSFWLHLVVETGLVGASAYALWLGMIVFPSIRRSWRGRGNAEAVGTPSGQAADRWAPVVILFGSLVAGLSPALEDPLFPPLLLGVAGLAWSLNREAVSEHADRELPTAESGR